ncbi:hypothetical protein [Prevotella pallens]|uniref:hypothetical protein n=1 Tax=Prevotella pallens TaxID=60133 RepID=UPI001CB103D4|nr:hypothetical protein [Prevotella pallens]MBF1459410.1 hypothetical protein [Prevotella pallens]
MHAKKGVFARQKPYFCGAKTILLHGEYVTHRKRTRCERSVKAFQTVCDNAADGLPNVSQRIANAWRIRICGHDKSAPYGC